MQDCCASVKHSAVFYNSHAELFSFASPYLKAGLENNELCFWVVPEDVSIDQARSTLRGTIDDLDRYIEKGQLTIGDHRTFYLKDNIFTISDTMKLLGEKENDAIQSGFNGICLLGDGSWAVQDSWFNFLIYEQEVESIINVHKIKGLCSYSLEKLDLGKIFEIGNTHKSSFVNQSGQWVTLNPDSFKKKF